MRSGIKFRYGIEVEGPFCGEVTLILPTAEWHTPEIVQACMQRHPEAAAPTHLWAETQQDERFNWENIERLIAAGYKVTVQVREPHDIPPVRLLEYATFGIVWMVPERFCDLLLCSSHIKWALAPGEGCEAVLNFRHFNAADYTKDQEWQP